MLPSQVRIQEQLDVQYNCMQRRDVGLGILFKMGAITWKVAQLGYAAIQTVFYFKSSLGFCNGRHEQSREVCTVRHLAEEYNFAARTRGDSKRTLMKGARLMAWYGFRLNALVPVKKVFTVHI